MNINLFNEWLLKYKKSPLLMGILNVTPDSFSDGGKFDRVDSAIQHAIKMESEGSDIIDIGGESSRPGAEPVSLTEELDRVIHVIEKLRKNSDIVISIDTYKSEVAEEALNAGANIINDISGLQFDSKMVEVASKYNVPIIIMHMLGNPQNMQKDPSYKNVTGEIISFFEDRIKYCVDNRIEKHNIIIDPGIGFGKTVEHNFILIRELKEFESLNCPILVGPSRKSFIGTTLNLPVDQRVEGTAATVTASIINGANILRVHDVEEMNRVIKITEKICGFS